MDERIITSLLLDFYGTLLTERQRYCIELHHEDDMSLGEIAEELGVSRQAVYDNLNRGKQLLETYETKLHLVAQYTERLGIIKKMKEALQQNKSKEEILQLLTQLEK